MINKTEFTISLYGLGEGERVLKPLGWLNCNSFLHLRCKRAYIVNLSKINWLVGRNCNIPVLGGGKGGEASRWTKTHLFVYLMDKKKPKLQILAKMVDKLQFSLFGWGERGDEAS